MADQADIDVLIDTNVRNYAPQAFHNMNLNQILHLINQNAGSGGGGSGSPAFATIFVTSADFTTAVDCPLPGLHGFSIAIFWNDLSRYLIKGTGWTPLVGGGFTILVPGFDATANSYSLVITPAAV